MTDDVGVRPVSLDNENYSDLVSEVPHAGENHRHVVFVSGLDGLLVPDRATGLDDGGNTAFGGEFDSISKGKESI